MGNSAVSEIDKSNNDSASSFAGRRRILVGVALSLLLLVPCFWQERIQAGDLSGHVYNAWLVSLTRQGRTPGLYVVRQWNNVAFDLCLEWLLVHVGAGAAQRITVGLAVLILAWGAIALATVISGKNWYFTFPGIAILAYGFVYHMGLFNYYLSMGICFWYLALVWKKKGWQRRLKAMPLLLLAWAAHPVPVVWAVGMALYVTIAQKMEPSKSPWFLGLAVLMLLGVREVLMKWFSCSWSWKQLYFITGLDQVMVLGSKYEAILAFLFFAWLITFRRLLKESGWRGVSVNLAFQLWILNAAAVFLLPDVIDFPQYGLPFSYLTDRLSLPAGVMACSFLASVRGRLLEKIVLGLAAAAFFSLIFVDTWNLNRLEDGVDRLVAQLPTGTRVLGYFPTQLRRISPSLHSLDRACIGHCFSYGNYEPSSRQFRLRAQPGNSFVLDDFEDAYAVQTGTYVVQARDEPVYLIYLCGDLRDRACLHRLQVGEVTGK